MLVFKAYEFFPGILNFILLNLGNGTKGPNNTYRFCGLKQREKKSNSWISFILVCGTEL